MEDLKS